MASLSDILGGTQSSASTAQYPTLNPQQLAALSALLTNLSGGGAASSPGVGTSLTALEQQAQAQAAGTTPTAGAISTMQDIMGTQPQDINAYFQSTVADPMMRQFTQQVLPQITQRFAGQAGFGSDRITAENLATQDLLNSMTTARASTAYQAYQDALTKRLQAAGMIPGASSANISNIMSTLSGQMAPGQQNIQDILSALSVKPFENITTVTPGQSGLLQGIAPGLGMGLGMNMSPFLSWLGSGAGGSAAGIGGAAASAGSGMAGVGAMDAGMMLA